jgi:predicted secreted protein
MIPVQLREKIMLRIVLLCILLTFNLVAQAAEGEKYNRVNFQVEAAREVANDLLVANMSADIQDTQPARVARQLNTVLNDALGKAAAFSAVKSNSGNQNTYPVYGKHNHIDAWRGHGEIRLESRDFKAAGELIMQLQSTMQLNGVRFAIAPETRATTENALIVEAIKAFQARAVAIRNALGAKSYKIVNISINNAGMPPPRPVALMRSGVMAESAIPAPEFAGGESKMTITINGTIEIQ